MPRTARKAPGDVIFHVLNRGVGRMELFSDDADYATFEKAMEDALEAAPMRILAWCLMPNHWHLVLWPAGGRDLGRFMQRLTLTHARRWALSRQREGYGHVYQGRFKSLPVQDDGHLRTMLRYVERNALRAGLVKRAEQWRWGSLWARHHAEEAGQIPLTSPPPRLPSLAEWTARVNAPQSQAEVDALRLCIHRGRPYGEPEWVGRMVKRLGLQSSLRPRGRPRKDSTGDVVEAMKG